MEQEKQKAHMAMWGKSKKVVVSYPDDGKMSLIGLPELPGG